MLTRSFDAQTSQFFKLLPWNSRNSRVPYFIVWHQAGARTQSSNSKWSGSTLAATRSWVELLSGECSLHVLPASIKKKKCARLISSQWLWPKHTCEDLLLSLRWASFHCTLSPVTSSCLVFRPLTVGAATFALWRCNSGTSLFFSFLFFWKQHC